MLVLAIQGWIYDLSKGGLIQIALGKKLTS